MADVTDETLCRLAVEIGANLDALGPGLDEVRDESRRYPETALGEGSSVARAAAGAWTPVSPG